jgi:DNA-binding transcriptional MerR regulator
VNFKELLIQETLPKKNLFNSSEVSSLLKVKPHEIRYWENEFPQIRSQKNKQGQRLYRKEDLLLFSAIKHLLHDKKFTIAGALKVLADADLFEDRVTNSEQKLAPDELLQASHDILPETQKVFDEQTHEIYQNCAEDLEKTSPPVIEPLHVGEMIADALTSHTHNQENNNPDYEKKLALLQASKSQLNDLLSSLDKFSPNDFWAKF